MEMNHSNESNDEPNTHRPKMETEVSTSSKPEAKDPFLSLPQDILVKIIGYTSIAQWPSLELLDKNFRAATLISWRQLRNINVDREFVIKPGNEEDESSSFGKSVKSIFQKLVEHSPFLTSLNGIDRLKSNHHDELDPDVVQLLAQFEHLQSITIFNEKLSDYRRRGMQLENVVEFLAFTRSRTSLKELRLYGIDQRSSSDDLLGYVFGNSTPNLPTVLDQFAKSLVVNGRDIYLPLKLEKFSFSLDYGNVRLDTVDTTRLTDVRVTKARIEPDQLTNLIERASYLRRIELSFVRCNDRPCNQRLQENKKLLAALGAHEKLMAIKFDCIDNDKQCTNFGREFIEMLKAIGAREHLRKLALEKKFVQLPHIDMNEICSTIHANKITNLQSVKVNINCLISDESVLNIVSLADLEEINIYNGAAGSGDEFGGVFGGGNPQLTGRVTANAINKIAQLPCLKRLAYDRVSYEDTSSLGCLADAPALMDLRIRHADWFNADVFEKWANGFASNLQVLMLGEVRGERGLVQILKKTARLRVLLLDGSITDRSLTAIAQSCPKLEILSVRSDWNEMTVGHLREVIDRYPQLETLSVQSVFDEIAVLHFQQILDRCPRLKKLGGIKDEIRDELEFPKYRKIGDYVDEDFWNYDFDDEEYD